MRANDASICEATYAELELPGFTTSRICTRSPARVVKFRSYCATFTKSSACRLTGTDTSSASLEIGMTSDVITNSVASHRGHPSDEPSPKAHISQAGGDCVNGIPG